MAGLDERAAGTDAASIDDGVAEAEDGEGSASANETVTLELSATDALVAAVVGGCREADERLADSAAADEGLAPLAIDGDALAAVAVGPASDGDDDAVGASRSERLAVGGPEDCVPGMMASDSTDRTEDDATTEDTGAERAVEIEGVARPTGDEDEREATSEESATDAADVACRGGRGRAGQHVGEKCEGWEEGRTTAGSGVSLSCAVVPTSCPRPLGSMRIAHWRPAVVLAAASCASTPTGERHVSVIRPIALGSGKKHQATVSPCARRSRGRKGDGTHVSVTVTVCTRRWPSTSTSDVVTCGADEDGASCLRSTERRAGARLPSSRRAPAF